MNATFNEEKEKLMKSYLLGELTEQDKARLEEQFFVDDDQFAELLGAEDRLIGGYLSGALSPAEQDSFEKYFLASPRLRRAVQTESLLRDAIGARITEPDHLVAVQTAGRTKRVGIFSGMFARPVVRWTMVMAAVVIVIGASWLVWRTALDADRLRSERSESQEKPEQSNLNSNMELAQPSSTEMAVSNGQAQNENRQNPQKPPNNRQTTESRPAIVTLLLTPHLTRGGGETPVLRISRSTRTVILRVPLASDDYKTYQASLQTPEGKGINQQAGLVARRSSSGEYVAVAIPARNFSRGDYILTLFGKTPSGSVEKVGEYAFTALVE